MEKFKKYGLEIFQKVLPSLVAIGIGLIIGLLIMLIFDVTSAFQGLSTIILGGFSRGMVGIGNMLFQATPIILTGLALVVAFKSGMFNIGAPGQMIIGAYVAIHIGVLWSLPPVIHWMVAILLGTLAGAIWGSIPGILKSLANTNEVISSILLNYIGTLLVILLVKTNVYNEAFAKSLNIQASAALPKLSFLFGSSPVHFGIVIAILAVAVVHFIFKYTTLGFELQASGFNKDASKYAGMSARKNVILSMVISGALAGLAGAVYYLQIGNNLGVALNLLGHGFDGISVALLGQSSPIGSFFAALFLANIREGGNFLQLYGYKPQLVEMIISVIIFTSAISSGLMIVIKNIMKNRKMKKEEKVEDK